MATYTCPHCNKQVKDLKGHIARMHPDQAPPPDNPEDAQDDQDAEDLEIKAPPEGTGYHCVDCGAALTRGQNPCPNCYAHLDWSNIQ